MAAGLTSHLPPPLPGTGSLATQLAVSTQAGRGLPSIYRYTYKQIHKDVKCTPPLLS